MEKLSGKKLILVGLTLFSMFFGAGNLIFPPFLGLKAGFETWPAMIGFAVSAIGFPILGVMAVARSGGLERLAGRVHPKFAFVFTLLIYLSIGPCLAIPRTASTSFEMAVAPFVSGENGLEWMQLVYSFLFFAIAFCVALRPDKLTDRLGKVMTPCLLTLICIIFAGCLLRPLGGYGIPEGDYSTVPLVKGFLEGYQTMDTIAALNFGIIISLNIGAMGIKQENAVVKETIKAGLIAGFILLLVYSALAYIGAASGKEFGTAENGARTLSMVVQYLFGRPGMIILALIFFIACLNTCIGLLSCCSKYFCTLFPRVGYRGWAAVFAGVSLLIANIGLNRILEFSVPVLNGIYPIAIVLIILSFLHPFIRQFLLVYPLSILFSGISSVVNALDQSGIQIPALTKAAGWFPFYDLGLGWIIPALAGAGVGIIAGLLKNGKSRGIY